ncbi:hypothetical protein IQ07DRAFT_300560 [Pyrenochaeta sp. DS3sAY3a]|nr:hypothetical protein IQ07DRAFT_300560 [Pyrenochaeta sp. DS3sAY3a]
MNEDTQIPDTDFHNVWQDVKSVVRLSQEALEKPREGMHGIHKAKLDELADAQSRLERDMHTLVNSPYTQLHEPPPIELSREAVTALRALWTILEDMKELPMDQRSCKDKELARAMQRAILSLNPNYEFNGNDFDEDMADKTGKAPA